jgi:hypothetical protein
LEEVKACRKVQEERSRRGILVNPSGAGIADTFRMADAEKRFKAMGLL